MKKNLYDLIGALIEQSCCFTGHRPQKLPWGFNEFDTKYLITKRKVREEIVKAIERGYRTFISGMALGFDMMCAEIVLELKRKNPDIKLVCAIPCRNQDRFWDERQKLKYKTLLNQAELTLYLHERYTKNCMQERNNFMVNNSSLVIALFDETEGGTADTIKFAKKLCKEIIKIKPNKEKESKEEIEFKIMKDKFNYYMNNINNLKDACFENKKDYRCIPDYVVDYIECLSEQEKRKRKKDNSPFNV